MVPYVCGLDVLDAERVDLFGGKAAGLARLSRLDGVRVPPGFCVSTQAFRRVVASVPALGGLLDRLDRLDASDREAITDLSDAVRRAIEAAAVPREVATAIADALGAYDAQTAWAVRSSATAEDLPGASSAGLHDSSLGVVGVDAVLDQVRRCWASLFTERAVSYRLRRGVGSRRVDMAVVVHRTIASQSAGVLFTADPVSSNRRVVIIEAVAGLGDALVSGRKTPDVFTVRDGEVVERAIVDQPVLTDAQAIALARLGRHLEAQLGRPQDIEWCLVDDQIHVVQSRPITTLFPVPDAGDGAPHVFLSVGHQQMMTDAMRPLGLSLYQTTSPRPMVAAAGRLWVDVHRELSTPPMRAALLGLMRKADPLFHDALATLVERGDFPPNAPMSAPPRPAAPPLEPDPAIVATLVAQSEASLLALEGELAGKTGPALLDAILADLAALEGKLFDPQSHRVVMAAIDAAAWLNEHLEKWLGDKNAADPLAQSVPGNVTSEMGLALLDVADAIRPHPEVIEFLEQVVDEDGPDWLARLDALDGGDETRKALTQFLDRYGMRCPGEIDVTRRRWRERPAALVRALLSHVARFETGEAAARFEQGRLAAACYVADVLERLTALPDGADKAAQTRQAIARLRTFAGYREYPKYALIRRYDLYKQALVAEAARLVDAGVLRESTDIFYLSLQELRDVVRTDEVDPRLIDARRARFESDRRLRPPRVITSDGEALSGALRRTGVPSGALVGVGVSAGIAEGRARVVLDMANADLAAGDILVTTFTDPSWTPLFLSVDGLVTEIGGRMTHGAVIAREYGLPAVVGVERATQRIRDGQRIRVHGTDGYVELLG